MGKEKPKGWDLNPIEWLIVMLLLASLISGLVMSLRESFSTNGVSFYGYNLLNIADFFRDFGWLFKSLGYVLAGAGAVGAFVFNKKADAIWRAEKARLNPIDMPIGELGQESAPVPDPTKERWQRVLSLRDSENPSDWRLSIIEADIMLDDLLRQLQLPGDTMGEKLKAVEPSDFLTLDQAWEAHKARNMIAHQGENFLLNQREVNRIISLYEAVFREFQII